MDRNTIIGFVLIALILIGFNFFNHTADDKAQKEKEKTTIDSSHTPAPTAAAAPTPDTAAAKTADSIPEGMPAAWAAFAKGTNQDVTLQNDDIILHVSTKGGRISYAQLKKYKTYEGKPLVMLKPESSSFNYQLKTHAADEYINTADLYFTPQNLTSTSVTMAVTLPGGESIQQVYNLEKEGYLVHNDLKLVKMNEVIPRNVNGFNIYWEADALKHEKDSGIAAHNATVYYRKVDDKPTYLSETSNDKKEFPDKTDWVSFKQQFFCQSFIATKVPFYKVGVETQLPTKPGTLKHYATNLALPFTHQASEVYPMHMYLGPLKYKTLKNIGEEIGSGESLEMERQIPLGWGFFLLSWVNKFIVIPVFNILSSFIGNYGIIILFLAVFIKILVLPFTYKTYLSTAKMRLIKPELDEMKKKNEGDMAKQQQEQMKLYRRAGVSPFGGCLPLLLQAPILIAMFRFFPSSIELRQEHFLWAKDLSTYDSIWDFGYVPIINGIYGDHVSLFTLLMTISTLIYTRMNNSLSPQQSEFKWMSYLMPIMFLGFFNKYSAGLSLYYFYFNILTFGQQYLFKLFINEDKLKAKIEENKKKPVKKSGLQARLEEMSKRQQELARQRSTNGSSPKKPTRRK